MHAASLARRESRRFGAFLAVGLVNTIFGYGVFVLIDLFSDSVRLAVVLSTTVGVLFNYLTTGRLVFANRGLRALAPFVMGYGVVLIANLIFVDELVRHGLHGWVAQALALPWLVVLSYSINRFVVFRSPGGASREIP